MHERIWSAPGPRWSTSCALSLRVSGPVRWGCSATCTVRSRSRSLSATPAPRTRAGWASSAFRRSWRASDTPAARSPRELLAKLRRAPEARVGELELSARRALVLSLVATIKTLNEQIKQLERQIATAIREHPDGPIFLSLFKKPNSVITAAELLAEIGDCRARYPTRDALAADAGQAAVAVESGKRKAACFRWACNKRLRGRSTRSPTPPATIAPLGAGPLRRRPRPRARPPPRDPHPRPRLVPHRVALLAGRRPLRPCPPPRAATACHGHDPHLVGPPARPRRHPADGRRRRHPNGRARRAERTALDGKPTSATALGG